ncbi:MAG TPA: SDR family oxidoreductase [Geminicoccaceae bacterium]|nr:SDR family oxidoreductase [Geminicoccaceae bacterium]
MTFATYPSLADRVVLITGGASGIGAEMVRQFAGNGARVAFLDIQSQAAQALVAGLARGAHTPRFLHCDVADIAALRAAVAEVHAALGPITVLVNNAGNDQRQASQEVSPESWRRVLALNLDHHFFACQAVRPHMRAAGGGAIVNLSSIAWMGGGAADLVAYSAAKAAIVGMTNSLAREYGDDGIRVNAIAPGAVLTRRQLELWYTDAAQVAAVIARQCLKARLAEADIARMALFLAADDSGMITKQCFIVDAGLR